MQTIPFHPEKDKDKLVVNEVLNSAYKNRVVPAIENIHKDTKVFLYNLDRGTSQAVGARVLINNKAATWDARMPKELRRGAFSKPADIMLENSSKPVIDKPVPEPISLAGYDDKSPLVEDALFLNDQPSNLLNDLYADTLKERKQLNTTQVVSDDNNITVESALKAVDDAFAGQSFNADNDQFGLAA